MALDADELQLLTSIENLISQGGSCLDSGDYAGAVENYTLALERFPQRAEFLSGVSRCLGNLGRAYRGLGKHEDARRHHEMALQLNLQLGIWPEVVAEYTSLGHAYGALGRYNEAAGSYEAAFALAFEHRDVVRAARAAASHSSALCHLGKHELAIRYAHTALDIIAGVPSSSGCADPTAVINAKQNLGITYNNVGKYEMAIEACTSALSYCETYGSSEDVVGSIRDCLGSAYLDLGRRDDALPHLEHALDVSRRSGCRREQAIAQLKVDVARGHTRSPEEYLQHLATTREINDRHGEGTALCALGNAYLELEQPADAIPRFEQALEISREIGYPAGEYTTLSLLGKACAAQNEHARAVCFCREALRVHDRIWHELGSDDWRITLGDRGLPRGSCVQLLQRELVALGGVAKLWALEEAERSRARSLELLLAGHHGEHSAQSAPAAASPQRSLAQQPACTWQQMREYAVRQRAHLLVFSEVGDRRVLAWLVRPAPDDEPLFRDLAWRGEHSLEALVQATRDAVAGILPAGRATGAPSGAQAEGVQPAGPPAAAVETRGEPCDEDDANVPDECVRASVRLGGGRAGKRPRDEYERNAEADADAAADALLRQCHQLLVEPFGDALGHGETLVVLPDSHLYALPFAALRDAHGQYLIQRHPLCLAPSVGALLQLEARPRPTPLGDEGKLHALVAGVSDYSAQAMPWTLRTEEDVDAARRDVRASSRGSPCRWVEARAIDGSTRIQLGELRRAEREQIAEQLAVGDVVGEALSDLEHAQIEALKVDFGLDRTDAVHVACLRGAAATKAEVLRELGSKHLVHLAVHGSPSGLVLHGGSEAEALLGVLDVQQLDLRAARLVLLSACDTFRGRLSAEGLLGISRAFLAAGCQTLVASLWPVNDEQTERFMAELYTGELGSQLRRLRGGTDAGAGGSNDGTIDVAAAMRETMCALLSRHRGVGTASGGAATSEARDAPRRRFKVRHWAPFVVFGAPRA